MRIKFSEISPLGNHFEVTLTSELANIDILSFQGVVTTDFFLKKKDEGKVEMKGRLQARPIVSCDRCLNTYCHPLQTDYHIIFELADQGKWGVKEIECNASDMETVLLEKPVVDITDIIRQQILLQLPGKSVCSEDCKGICSQCGSNLNDVICDCKQQEEMSPFAAALSKLNENIKI